MVRKKAIKWKKGRPMMICPKCGGNSGPDFIDFSRKDKPATVIMKCEGCGEAWGFEVDQAKAPDGTFYRSAQEVNVT